MKCFQENICRICQKTFCCKDCRAHHEEQFHKVNPECEICIYGRMTIKNASVLLLNHIKAKHWPLHCVFCKKIFDSLDELIPHEKCSVKMETLKIQVTPKTPVTPVSESNEPSPMITPFYKSNDLGKHQAVHSTISMAVTSTPLIHKGDNDDDDDDDDDGDNDKITPINSEIKFICKSNLKLTGSSNLSDSKKSERRVTFSETPSVSELVKKPKYFPLEQHVTNNQRKINNNSTDSADDSYSSLRDEDEIYETISSPSTFNEEKENIDNKMLLHKSSNMTVWESALTNLCTENSKNAETTDNVTSHFNLSLQINVFNETFKTDACSSVNSIMGDASFNKSSLWSSMTNIVKSVLNNISFTAQNSLPSIGVKRSQPDSDSHVELPRYKRMKLTELKCRRPIRDLSPLCQIRLGKSNYVDKATQTDEIWM